MQNFNIYIDYNGDLIFSRIDDKKEKVITKNNSVLTHIDDLSRCQIYDISENGKDITIQYKKFFIHIFDYQKVLNKPGMSVLRKNIKLYIEKRELVKVKGKKVTRKNKHTKGVVFASGLALILLASHLVMSNVKAEEKGNTYILENFEHSYVEMPEQQYIKEIIIDNDIIDYERSSLEEIDIVDDELNNKFYIEYEDRSLTDKANTTKTLYGDIITKYATMYGLDHSLVIGIATQERGVHSQTMDRGGATGLMQIQNSVWENSSLSAYNYNTNCVETITVDIEKVSDLDYNIKVGCMILQNTMKYMDYNVFAGVQCYNMGYGNMQKILAQYSIDTGKSIDEILKSNDLGWLDYRTIIPVGDQRYLENVLSWIGNEIDIENMTPDGIQVSTCISAINESKKVISN